VMGGGSARNGGMESRQVTVDCCGGCAAAFGWRCFGGCAALNTELATGNSEKSGRRVMGYGMRVARGGVSPRRSPRKQRAGSRGRRWFRGRDFGCCQMSWRENGGRAIRLTQRVGGSVI
jgi:hypothetical protein